MAEFSHLDAEGSARMVDVSDKPPVRRTAVAAGKISLSAETVRMIREKLIEKGDVLTVARIAGIMGAKRTPELIPLAHSLGLDHADVECTLEPDGVAIRGTVRCTGRTGVEMEALTAVSVAALTIYDMCKAVDKHMEIGAIHLLDKRKEAADGGDQPSATAKSPREPEAGTTPPVPEAGNAPDGPDASRRREDL
jgi:cyclic pyranopterin phosphate synthase